jgi:hypothetical protein
MPIIRPTEDVVSLVLKQALFLLFISKVYIRYSWYYILPQPTMQIYKLNDHERLLFRHFTHYDWLIVGSAPFVT